MIDDLGRASEDVLKLVETLERLLIPDERRKKWEREGGGG